MMIEPFLELGSGEQDSIKPMDLTLMDFLEIDEGGDAFMGEGEEGFDGVCGMSCRSRRGGSISIIIIIIIIIVIIIGRSGDGRILDRQGGFVDHRAVFFGDRAGVRGSVGWQQLGHTADRRSVLMGTCIASVVLLTVIAAAAVVVVV
jgi:hypothetical protein